MNKIRMISCALGVAIIAGIIYYSSILLPDTVRKEYTRVVNFHNVITKQFEQYHKEINDCLKKEIRLEPYAKKEKWVEKLNESFQLLNESQSIINKQAKPLVNKNREEESVKILTLIREARAKTQKVDIVVNAIYKNCNKLVEAIRELEPRWKLVSSYLSNATKQMNSSSVKKDKAIKTYPFKEKNIREKWLDLTIILDTMKSYHKKYELEMVLEESDYYKLAQYFNKCKHRYTLLIQKELPKFNRLLNELDYDREIVLIDMRVEKHYYAEFGKTTWDEWSDWDTDTDSCVVREINESMYKKITPNVSYESGYEYEKWYGEKWVEYRFFHKYKKRKNDKVITTNWIQVEQDDFEEYEDDLGMIIESKPKGYYESETRTTSSPPKYVYANNPVYGEWVEKKWVFYPEYNYLDDDLIIEYDDWQRYHAHRGVYYGNKKTRRWGTKGKRTVMKYRRSNVIKRSYGRIGNSYGARGFRGRGPSWGK